MKKKLIGTILLALILITVMVTGCTGEQGLKGSKGDTGEEGIQGTQGEQGLQGVQGKQGLQGEQGEVGLQGVIGRTGAKGATGSVGATGEQGLQGIQGPAGTPGSPGATGATGPASLFTVSLTSQNSGMAQVRPTPYVGTWSIELSAAGTIAAPDEGTIVITPVVPLPLGYLQSISWQENLVMGYPPHIDIYLDNDGDGVADDSLNVEYAYNTMVHYAEAPMPYGALTGAWYSTFSDDGNGPTQVDDSCYAWLNSGTPGPPGGGGHTGGTLAQWKANTLGTFDTNSTIVKIELEVDNWVVHSVDYVDQITINGIVIWAR